MHATATSVDWFHQDTELPLTSRHGSAVGATTNELRLGLMLVR
jgi:hypothetical protein